MYTTKHSACSTTHRLALVAAVPLSAALLLSGAGAANAARLPEGSSGTTSISWTIVNTTGVNLTLATASNPYGHWQKRPVNLASGQSETISDYSDNIAGAELKVTYTEPTGHRITMTLTDPIAGDDTLTGSSNDSTIGFDNSLNHGYHVSGTTEINQGRVTLDTPGGPFQYVVPAGVTQLQVKMSGGAGGGSHGPNTSNVTDGYGGDGTELSGIIPVTPGEVLDVAVGGAGGTSGSTGAAGGWGETLNGQNFSGGSGANGGGGGGGASVISENGTPLVVAAGGGGGGLGQPITRINSNPLQGANGGYNANGNSLVGIPGYGPGGTGGQLGGQTVSQGQSVATGQDGGAGGGGVLGGGAGGTDSTDKVGGGGGAGTSLVDTLTVGADSSSYPGNVNGQILLTPYFCSHQTGRPRPIALPTPERTAPAAGSDEPESSSTVQV